jgi:hypothetical protein
MNWQAVTPDGCVGALADETFGRHEQGHTGTPRIVSGNRATEKHIIVVEAAEQSCHTWTEPSAAPESPFST